MSSAISLVLALSAVVAAGGAAASRGLDDPAHAPSTVVSGDGRSVSGAGRTLSISQADSLVPGQAITVTGSGYDVDKGIYVALCVIPPTDRAPEPCAGGQDRAGSSGTSNWISSNPPSYGVGLAKPYGPGGSFRVTVIAQPTVNEALDCYSVRCAVITRNDHIRASDRSQDLFVPVTFSEPGSAHSLPTTPTTTTAPLVPATTAPPIPTTTLDATSIAPSATVAADGNSVSDGTRTLAVSIAQDLDPSGQRIEVSGSGFDPDTGVYVALCRITGENRRPEPCTVPPQGAAWLTPEPPAYAADFARRVGPGGTFRVTLDLAAHIDATTDCREVACAITVRRDDTAPQDRRADLILPVHFADHSPTMSTTTVTGTSPIAVTGSDSGVEGDSPSVPWAPIAVVVVAFVAIGASIVVRRRISGRPDPTLDAAGELP